MKTLAFFFSALLGVSVLGQASAATRDRGPANEDALLKRQGIVLLKESYVPNNSVQQINTALVVDFTKPRSFNEYWKYRAWQKADSRLFSFSVNHIGGSKGSLTNLSQRLFYAAQDKDPKTLDALAISMERYLKQNGKADPKSLQLFLAQKRNLGDETNDLFKSADSFLVDSQARSATAKMEKAGIASAPLTVVGDNASFVSVLGAKGFLTYRIEQALKDPRMRKGGEKK